jgi:choline-sulfatase
MHQRPPNILFLMSDQHSPFVTGCYGNTVVHTPHLDALAEEGSVFDAAYCASPVCVPSRLSMLSGRHPHQIRVWGLGDTIPSTTPTWPVPLSIAGWHTVMCGRMHLAWGDRNHGFETRLCGDAYPTIKNHFAHWKNQEPDVSHAGRMLAESGIGTARQDAEDDITLGHALKFIHGLNPEHMNRPFALCVGFSRPHTPFLAPPELMRLYEDFEPELEMDPGSLPPFYRSLYRHFGFDENPPSLEDARRAIRAYYAMVTGLDRRIGQIRDALQSTGLWENTIVIYASDHGESLGRHGLWFKSSFYEESVRVPLILRIPGGPAGMRTAEPVSLLDLFPTLCDIAGVEPPGFLDGCSLLPLLNREPLSHERSVFAEYADYGIHTPLRMVRRGQYKLIYAAGYAPLLFDLQADPHETIDLAGSSPHQEIVGDLLREALHGWDPEAIRRQVLENQSHRDLFVAAEEAIRKATGKPGFPWR